MIFSSRQLRRSFSFALSGLRRVLHDEQNFRLQMLVGLLVIVAMFFFDLSSLERAVLTLAIAFILVLELMNSIFERVAICSSLECTCMCRKLRTSWPERYCWPPWLRFWWDCLYYGHT